MTPLVSICVPVYNVAPYIERCVRSIMEQDYQNIEYIFVDDGSTDNSVQRLKTVLTEYPERKSMAHIYHNDRNHGLAYTRRVTIEKASGEYITCVDSDDWIDTNYISALIQETMISQSDVIFSPCKEHLTSKTIVTFLDEVEDSYFNACVKDKVSHLWGKLIRRDLILEHSCFAPEGLDYLEDRIALLQISHYVSTVSHIDNAFYHYIHQPQSITAHKTDYHFDCLIRYWQEAEQLMREWGTWEQYASICQKQQVEDKIALMLHCNSNATRRQYANLYREYELKHLNGLSAGFQIMGRLVHYHLWPLISIYQIYINWLNKRKK